VKALLSARPRVVILVEGESDRAALETLARRQCRDLGRERVVVQAMGGVTNIGHFLAALAPAADGIGIRGIYDLPQERYVRWALEQAGFGARLDRRGLELLGFHACIDDLEDELIRALGVGGVVDVIRAAGELESFRRMQHQPAQRSRTDEQQIRRFLAGRSGNKAVYARRFVEALDLAAVPQPLVRVLASTLYQD